MERNTKRIIAIIAILAVAGAGIGVGVWFVMQPEENPYTYPGLDGQKPLSQTIKIGVLDDMSQTGIFSYHGAILSAMQINLGGGIDINGTTYWIGLVSEDTKEASYDNDAANAAALKMIEHKPHAILGGFRSETFEVYIQRIMDADIPYMVTGCATTRFLQEWLGNTATRDYYKWLFRCMPLNSQHLGEHLSYLLIEEIIPRIEAHQNRSVDNMMVVYEDLIWTQEIADMVIANVSAAFPDYLGEANISEQLIPRRGSIGGWTPSDFEVLWGSINTDGTQLVVPIISDMVYGGQFSKPYNTTKADALIAGINVNAQSSSHWGDTEGGCEYEVTTHAIAYVNFTERSIPFYDSFINLTTQTIGIPLAPIYTGVGGGDALNLFAHAISEAQSTKNTDIVAELEKIDEDNPFPGINALIGFDENHDVLETIPEGPNQRLGFFSVPYRQYHPDGSLPIIPCGQLYDWDGFVPTESKSDLIFPDWWPAAT
ncbi:MAG: hypothetical protein EU543_01345 [Promethearchaeota archaeon]|nr:MAG: hypothetical protein EU543_01345 [Candidatus Lokiarchaeota archaeon]